MSLVDYSEFMDLKDRIAALTAESVDSDGVPWRVCAEAAEKELTRWRAKFSSPEICEREVARLREIRSAERRRSTQLRAECGSWKTRRCRSCGAASR